MSGLPIPPLPPPAYCANCGSKATFNALCSLFRSFIYTYILCTFYRNHFGVCLTSLASVRKVKDCTQRETMPGALVLGPSLSLSLSLKVPPQELLNGRQLGGSLDLLKQLEIGKK